MKKNHWMLTEAFEPLLARLDEVDKERRSEVASIVYKAIKKKAHAMKVTGNLEKGVYKINGRRVSFVGIRQPAFHNYLIEFGHWMKTLAGRIWVKGRPIVYPSFEEAKADFQRVYTRKWL